MDNSKNTSTSSWPPLSSLRLPTASRTGNFIDIEKPNETYLHQLAVMQSRDSGVLCVHWFHDALFRRKHKRRDQNISVALDYRLPMRRFISVEATAPCFGISQADPNLIFSSMGARGLNTSFARTSTWSSYCVHSNQIWRTIKIYCGIIFRKQYMGWYFTRMVNEIVKTDHVKIMVSATPAWRPVRPRGMCYLALPSSKINLVHANLRAKAEQNGTSTNTKGASSITWIQTERCIFINSRWRDQRVKARGLNNDFAAGHNYDKAPKRQLRHHPSSARELGYLFINNLVVSTFVNSVVSTSAHLFRCTRRLHRASTLSYLIS
jgi:hypothetical protein